MHGFHFEVLLERLFSCKGAAAARVGIQVANLLAQSVKKSPNWLQSVSQGGTQMLLEINRNPHLDPWMPYLVSCRCMVSENMSWDAK
jgi:hypothetical protein